MPDRVLNVVHIYKDYYPIFGGIENHVRTLAEAQAAAGMQVTVLVTRPEPGPGTVTTEAGVQVIRARRLATVASTPLSLDLPARLARLRPDLVHLHFPYPVGEVANSFLGQSHRTVITYHSDVVRQRGILRFYRPLMTRILRRADKIVATSPNYIASSPILRPLAERCIVVPLGIDPTRFDAFDPIQAQAIRARLQGPERQPVLLFVGRLRYYKGLDDLLRALPGIPARLAVIGTGPMEAQWKSLAEALRLRGQVLFLGDIPDAELPAYYRAADLYVLPATARSEAFGIALLEAMVSGLPAITTEVGTGTSYVNQHGVTGLIVPPRSPSDLASAIRSLLADPTRLRAMGESARQRVLSEFTADKMIHAVNELYRTLIPGFNHRSSSP